MTHPNSTRPIRGARVIAKILGVSERTVRRLAKKGLLPTHKLGGSTSPLTLSRADLARLRDRTVGED